jgi:FtsH-binding integral membrane protein
MISPMRASGSDSGRSLGPVLVAALAFAALVLATPLAAFLLREPLKQRGAIGLAAFLALLAVTFVLCVLVGSAMVRAGRGVVIEPRADRPSAVTAEQWALMLAFKFRDEDLAANRRRQLSARQRRNTRSAGRLAIFMGGLALGVTYVSIGLVYWLSTSGDNSIQPTADDRVGMAIAVLIITALVGGSLVYSYFLLRDSYTGKISVTEGTATRLAPGDDPRTHGYPGARIGEAVFLFVDDEQERAVDHATRYRVFYLKGPMCQVLSIEIQ